MRTCIKQVPTTSGDFLAFGVHKTRRFLGHSNHAKWPVATVGTCFMHVRT